MKPFWKTKAFWLLCYLLLLALSSLIRTTIEDPRPPSEDQQTLSLKAQGTNSDSTKTITLAYRDIPADSPNAPTLLMLHGSPMASESLSPLSEKLRGKVRMIIPDLPGFGNSTQSIPNYSLKAHAAYMRELLDKLNLSSVHLLGYSMGGGVALRLYEQAPERVASLTLLASIGVQEAELTGNYTLNHALHGLQWVTLWAGQNLLPHFGALDSVLLNQYYARNFYDSDQRDLRAVIQRLKPPTLIIHAEKDRLVPIQAALEHHRLMPQSQLYLYSGNHITPIRKPEEVAPAITHFLSKAQSGALPTREQATVERLRESEKPFGKYTLQYTGTALILLMVLLALATLASEDLACISAGILAASGTIPYPHAAFACFVGIFIGDGLLFLCGKWLGKPALNHAPMRWLISKAQVNSSQQWLKKRGAIIIIATRFLPGSRLPTYFAAGMLGLSFWKFALAFAIAAAIWTPLLVGIAYTSGEWILHTFVNYERYALPALIGLIIIVTLFLNKGIPLFTWRGRRLALGRWRRATHWEYWSRQRMYAPVLLYIFSYLGWRYGLRSCTVANPAFDGAGGLIGESKLRILELLRQHEAPVARYTTIEAHLPLAQKLTLIENFLGCTPSSTNRCVIKPDIGQRGEGVSIIRSIKDAETYLSSQNDTAIVQEYIPGVEYGIFYTRMPDEDKGQIISVTDKQYTSVTGDGKCSVEELILRDERAVNMAEFFLEKYATSLNDIIPEGEQFMLGEIGTHCRGALFLDGQDILTPELAEAVNAFAYKIEGFHFGRFDIKAPSKEAFMRGESLSILELNGLTSECTHMYNPGYTLANAYRTLLNQWRLAYQIGHANRQHGHEPQPKLCLIRYLLRHLSQ